MFPQMVPISDLRRRSRELLVMLSAGPVVIMRHSRPAAVLVDFNEYQELMEAIHDARDREILSELRAEADQNRRRRAELTTSRGGQCRQPPRCWCVSACWAASSGLWPGWPFGTWASRSPTSSQSAVGSCLRRQRILQRLAVTV